MTPLTAFMTLVFLTITSIVFAAICVSAAIKVSNTRQQQIFMLMFNQLREQHNQLREQHNQFHTEFNNHRDGVYNEQAYAQARVRANNIARRADFIPNRDLANNRGWD
jgi:hypothetical protein